MRGFPVAVVTAFVVGALLWTCLGQPPWYFHSRMSRSRFDIVLSHFTENPIDVRRDIEQIKMVPGIAQLNPRVILYAKGPIASPCPDPCHQLDILREQVGADIVRPLPNVGRESDTYLTHIIDNFDDLADHTLFGQATFHDPDVAFSRLRTHFNSTVGALGLGPLSTCGCHPCTHHWGSPKEGWRRIPQIYSIFNEDFCPPEGLLLTFRGQFIVSRNRIRRNPRRKFNWMKQVLNNMTHFVHEDYKDSNDFWFDSAKAADNPYFGHTVERSWLLMFGCNDVLIETECRDDDSSTRCGCYD
jgi:hypothetical protein